VVTSALCLDLRDNLVTGATRAWNSRSSVEGMECPRILSNHKLAAISPQRAIHAARFSLQNGDTVAAWPSPGDLAFIYRARILPDTGRRDGRTDSSYAEARCHARLPSPEGLER
jgi:hypothetical protein